MNADRETNHDMTNGDIASMLAGAADEVEIGIAPYEAVIRGGRRRKARRWAVAAATALVLAGSSATLAVAGLPGGDRTVVPAATRSATPAPDLFTPARTTLATGTENGKEWRVAIDVWPAPRTEAQAAGQLEAMGEYGEAPAGGGTKASDLIGKSSYVVYFSDGDKRRKTFEDVFMKDDTMSGTDLQTASIPFAADPDGPQRLVIGMVGKNAQQVTCAWKNGTTTKADRAPANTEIATDQPTIRPAEGSPVDWFVCLAPKGTAAQSAEVTAVR
ncbi:hypothetical protein ABZ835_00890 [Streptomyces sp. NPDC047461]|uniref:hypothetical protein n=1 Tax=Streptomyces sp. NPDC047461 TaxID=3155619 RepID=UPI0033DCA0E0